MPTGFAPTGLGTWKKGHSVNALPPEQHGGQQELAENALQQEELSLLSARSYTLL